MHSHTHTHTRTTSELSANKHTYHAVLPANNPTVVRTSRSTDHQMVQSKHNRLTVFFFKYFFQPSRVAVAAAREKHQPLTEAELGVVDLQNIETHYTSLIQSLNRLDIIARVYKRYHSRRQHFDIKSAPTIGYRLKHFINYDC